jgi:hypothetical protein
MDSKAMAENIATAMRQKDDDLKAWEVVLRRKLTHERLHALGDEVQSEITRRRSDPSYCESLAQFQRELDASKDDSALISLLYSWGLVRVDVVPD